jgi:hypothetical protein
MLDDPIDLADMRVIRDLWEMRWGYTFAQARRGTYWHAVGWRLHDAGWTWTSEQGGVGRFKLLPPVVL